MSGRARKMGIDWAEGPVPHWVDAIARSCIRQDRGTRAVFKCGKRIDSHPGGGGRKLVNPATQPRLEPDASRG